MVDPNGVNEAIPKKSKKTKKNKKNIPKIPDENGFTQILELRWTKLGATPF